MSAGVAQKEALHWSFLDADATLQLLESGPPQKITQYRGS